MKFIGLLERKIYLLILKQRKRILERTEKRIEKYELKLLVEQKFYENMKEDLRFLLKKGTYM